MKLKEFIETFDKDIDVVDDYSEELCIAYCGTKLTEAGYEHYSPILSIEIDLDTDPDYAILLINQDDLSDYEIENRLNLACEMFNGMAGYCSETFWNKYFI